MHATLTSINFLIIYTRCTRKSLLSKVPVVAATKKILSISDTGMSAATSESSLMS